MTHLSLFTGIGGLDLAAERAGFTTVGQCELSDYATRVLEKHWPDVPRWRDIRTLTGVSFHERTGLRTVDVLSGGFPCQPFSIAGAKKGIRDDRFLWPEMRRVIAEIRPRWVVGENVANFVHMALDGTLLDLETLGYEAWAIVFPACAVDAPHERMRTAIIAHADGERGEAREPESPGQRRETWTPDGGHAVAHAGGEGREGREQPDAYPPEPRGREERASGAASEQRSLDDAPRSGRGWPAEPGVGRMAHGIPCRVDRLGCLGNAVVPRQFYPIFQAIADMERTSV